MIKIGKIKDLCTISSSLACVVTLVTCLLTSGCFELLQSKFHVFEIGN